MVNRVPSGSKKLDEAVSGGFLEGSILLVTGEPGAGKSTFLRKFLETGLKNKEDCIYLLTNKDLNRTLTNMERLGIDVKPRKNLKFIVYDGVVKERNASFVGNFEDLVDVAYNCERMISSFKKKPIRMVIDDVSYLFLMNNKDVVFKFLHRLIQILRQKNVTCLMEVQEGMLDPQIMTALESMVDGTIAMKREMGRRYIKVTRYEEDIKNSDWMVLELVEDVELIGQLEQDLDHWEKTLIEHDPEKAEKHVKRLLTDMRKVPKKA
jgi:KaiC/GvpD/RAD55 family RecA-like ATPase